MSFRDGDRGRYGQNYRQNYRGRLQDNYRNDCRRGNYREMQNYKVSRITEVDIETVIEMTTEILTEATIKMTIEMTILKEVEVGLWKDIIHIMSEGMTEAVVGQDPDQVLVQEPVQR